MDRAFTAFGLRSDRPATKQDRHWVECAVKAALGERMFPNAPGLDEVLMAQSRLPEDVAGVVGWLTEQADGAEAQQLPHVAEEHRAAAKLIETLARDRADGVEAEARLVEAVEIINGIVAEADRETNPFIRARAFIASITGGGDNG